MRVLQNLLVLLLVLTGLTLPATGQACSGSLHLETGPTGVYQLDYAEAIQAQPGLDGCPIADLRMQHQGEEIPIRVISQGDQTFGPGDRIEWLAYQLHGQESWFNPNTRSNVYELGSEPGERLRYQILGAGTEASNQASLSRHVHLETDHMMMRLTSDQVEVGEQPDVWYWAKMTMVDPKPFQTRFDLPDLQPDFADPQMTLAFRGWSTVPGKEDHPETPDHQVTVSLNGTQVAELTWDGKQHITRTLSLPAGLLKASDNTLTLDIPSRQPDWAGNPLVDVVMFDYIDMHYPLHMPGTSIPFGMKVTSSGSPRLRGDKAPLLFGSNGIIYKPTPDGNSARYAAVDAGVKLYPAGPDLAPLKPAGLREVADQKDWRKPDQGYDYIILSHPSLMQAIEPLADFHRQRGLKTVVIDVNAAYDQFNHGIANPTAIRDLLKYAYQNWPAPKPHYVLLVGDASFDPHDEMRQRKFYSTWTDRGLLLPGRFQVIDGTSYEDKPTAANARNLVPTFQYFAYEGQSASDNRFVAFEEGSNEPMMAIGRFPVVTPEEVTAIVDKTIRYVTEPKFSPWRQSVMFITNDSQSFQVASNRLATDIGKMGFSPVKVYPQSSDKDNSAHQQKLMQEFNQGQLLVHFLGHGGRYIWRTGPPSPVKNHDLFTLDNVAHLDNGNNLPMILSMTCYSAPFDNPAEDSIGEAFLREGNKGAIAVFAASWRNAPDAAFSKDLMENLLSPGNTIGDAILDAKRATSNPDMIGMYNLLGDPAIALQRPREVLQITQVKDRWKSRIAVQVPDTTSFHGKLKVQWLGEDYSPISETIYHIDSPRLMLPQAPAEARYVRAYALDPARDTDAVGEFKIPEKDNQFRQRPWWMPDPPPVPLPPAEDRIHGSNFGG